MKVDTEIVQQVLQQSKLKLDPDLIRTIFDDVREMAAANAVPRAKHPKKPFLLVVSDPNGVIPEGTELTGWAVQIDDEKDITTLPDSLQRAAQDFNASKKGEKLPADTIADVFESATSKQFVAHGVYRRHKEPVFVIVTNNKVVKDTGSDA